MLKRLYTRLKDNLTAKLRAIDPKLVAAGVTYIGVRVVTEVLDLPLDTPVTDIGPLGSITYGSAIAYAAAAAAGWWKSNAATILRTPQESGNALPPAGAQ